MKSKFEKQYEYYKNLYNIVPEEIEKFGQFGIESWHDLVSEGIIHTYPKSSLIKFLISNGLHVTDSLDSPTDNYQHEKTKTIVSTISKSKVKDVTKYINKLNDSIFLYGYKVAKFINNDEEDNWRIIIEPKFPSEITTKNAGAPFYHLTYKQYLPKIQKIGLTPRDSKTIFTHPGSRIYIIQTNDTDNLQQLKFLLASGRYKNTKDNYPNYLPDQLENIKAENMVVLRIDVSDLKLFEDPMFPTKNGSFNACFTTQNIPPSNITLTNL